MIRSAVRACDCPLPLAVACKVRACCFQWKYRVSVVVAETKVIHLASFECMCESNQAVSAKTNTLRRAHLNLRTDGERFRLGHMHDIAVEFAGLILTFTSTNIGEISVTDSGQTLLQTAAAGFAPASAVQSSPREVSIMAIT